VQFTVPVFYPLKRAKTLIKSFAMGKVFTFKNLGIATRMATDQAKRSHGLNALWQGVRAWAVHFAHVMHQLWLEVVGFVFLAIAGIGAIGIVREYSKYEAGKSSYGRVMLAVCFTLLFVWFGVTSFWRLRRKLAAMK
jgi:hypothetical protein